MRLVCVLIFGCIATLIACGGNGTPVPPPPTSSSVLYLDAGSVLAFTVNTDGSLTRLTDPHDLGIGPLLVASSPFLLAEHSGPFSTDLVVAKATIPSGDLALVSSAGLPVIGSSPFAFLNVCGNEVFAGNDLQAAGMFSISTDGQLTLKGPAISYAGIPSATVTDSTCKFLYVPDTASGEIHVYQNTSGILSEIGPSPFIAGHAVGARDSLASSQTRRESFSMWQTRERQTSTALR